VENIFSKTKKKIPKSWRKRGDFPQKLSMAEYAEIEASRNPLQALGLSVSSPDTIKTPDTFVYLAVAFALILTRRIPRADIAFSIAYPLYLSVANRFRFDRNILGRQKEVGPLLREGLGPWFKNYVTVVGLVGVICPVFLCLAPEPIADAAAPHLYLTCCQVVMETLTQGPDFYPLMRLMTIIGFNAYRLRPLWMWVSKAWNRYDSVVTSKTPFESRIWESLGLIMAVANLLVWSYNLFVFLLLRVVPQYLNPVDFPPAEVSWKAQLIPIVRRRWKLASS